MATSELSLDQLHCYSGGNYDSKIAKILKPKPKKKDIKIPKPLVYDLYSAVKWGASPGPIYELPKHAYQNQQQHYQAGY